jgi:outer membrane protein with beta-barrel domain
MKQILVALAAAALVSPAALADSEFSVVLQGGATHYTSSLNSGSDTGAAYGARLGFLPTPMLGIEVGYLGSQNNIKESLDLGRVASTISTNEGYGDVRINILPGSLTPYVFGGYGLTWVSGGAASGIPNRSVNTLPFGGGLEANIGNFKIGGRFQYNYLFDRIYTGQNAAGTTTGIGADKGGNSDFWGVSLDVGASFR